MDPAKKKVWWGSEEASLAGSTRRRTHPVMQANLRTRALLACVKWAPPTKVDRRWTGTTPTRRRRGGGGGAQDPSESCLTGTNAGFLGSVFDEWVKNPDAVDPSWRNFFQTMGDQESGTKSSVDENVSPRRSKASAPTDASSDSASTSPSSPALRSRPRAGATLPPLQPSSTHRVVREIEFVANDEAANLVHLVRGFQTRGHLLASLDPLNIHQPSTPSAADLSPESFGFSDGDMDKQVTIPIVAGAEGILGGALGNHATLRNVFDALRATYSSTGGVEYMHIPSREKTNFLRGCLERDLGTGLASSPTPGWGRFLTTAERKRVLSRLHYAEMFEQFLASRWNTIRRFGLEGLEAAIPGLKAFVDRSSELGTENFVMGMAHRGRLNVLTNVLRKPLEMIFSEFLGTNVDAKKHAKQVEEEEFGTALTGDVKYHLGTTFRRTYEDGRTVDLSLLANPSHLEAVNPLVHGKCRAKQFFDPSGTFNPKKSVSVLVHGDASFSGQGVVYEAMQLAKLAEYSTGGTLHVLFNNQVGFTTDPVDERSTRYASDLGKAFGCPIFHVNADDPEAVAFIFKVAAEWRQTYLSDVIVDVIGYRRWGHNELDEARFTQPTMYDVIRSHPTVLTTYSKRVVEEGRFSQDYVDSVHEETRSTLEAAYERAKTKTEYHEEWLDSKWQGFRSSPQIAKIKTTGVDRDALVEVGEATLDLQKCLPPKFTPHPVVAKVMRERLKALHDGEGLDWGTAEVLAWGSLLVEGNHVRLSGQDSQRGTFAHRHSVLHCVETNAQFVPLNHIYSHSKESGKTQAEFHSCNSPLSEYAVAGFELGFSLENPDALVMWEAQYGDFANGAQVIMDQFIASQEAKWGRQTGLVWLLPHGYDGQGPEHSSCRLERFLQLSDEPRDAVPSSPTNQAQKCNIQVANVTTPAQMFHLLRRQIHRDFRKPLVVATPKSLLRVRESYSSLEDFAPPHTFQRVIFETDPHTNEVDDAKIRKLVFVVGKLYYELVKRRAQASQGRDVAIVRIEQVSPFPFDLVADSVRKYPNAHLVFAQEEPANMGNWNYIDDRIYTATRVLLGTGRRCDLVSRRPAASPAEGFGGAVHQFFQDEILRKVLS